jgi:hypothetical protein
LQYTQHKITSWIQSFGTAWFGKDKKKSSAPKQSRPVIEKTFEERRTIEPKIPDSLKLDTSVFRQFPRFEERDSDFEEGEQSEFPNHPLANDFLEL